MEKKNKSTTSKKSNATKTKDVVKPYVKEEVKDVVVEKEVKKPTKSDHSLFKVLAIVLIAVAVITWFIKTGTWDYSGAAVTFTQNEEPVRTGIHEFFLSFYYSISYYLAQLVFLAILGIFYGVISKTKGYKVMIKKISSLFKGKEVIFTLAVSLIIAGLTSVVTQPIVVLLFIPMLYSVAKELKINKVSAFVATYGALAVGLMGLTIGSYGLTYAAQAMSLEVTAGMTYRIIALVVGYLAINTFIVIYNKKKNTAEVVEDNFEVIEDEKGGKAWPYFILFGLLLVITVLGYVGWNSVLKIDAFDTFHEWLTTKVVVGEKETPIIGQILGNVAAFGTWDPYVICYILFIILFIVKFAARIKINDLLDNALCGLKKMAKPITLVVMAYAVFVLCYWSGITSTIVNFFNSGENFNVYLNALGNTIADFLHVDVEYTGFLLGQFYVTKFAGHEEQIMAIMSLTNGLFAFIAPTSMFMLTGLALSKLSYKDYFKAIWKFLIALVIVICLLLTIFTMI